MKGMDRLHNFFRAVPTRGREIGTPGRLLAAFLLIAASFYLAAAFLEPRKVGDGDEYYAMQLAWSADHRPYMREAGWRAYQEFYESAEVGGHIPDSARLAKRFPELTVAGTADFNHFWFYPMLAAAIDLAAGGPGAGLSVHGSFMALHAILFALALVLAWRWQGFPGLAAAALLILGSPALWSLDKVHTEFFTVCLTVIALAAAVRRRWSAASLAMALASTQNISFALPAFAAGCFALLAFWRDKRRPGMPDLLLLGLSAIAVLLHPVYYYLRYAVVTPQLYTMGAAMEDVSPSRALLFLFDLDVGLLPNWPAGLAIILVASILWFMLRPRTNWWLITFMAIVLAANLLAHGGTTNLNSGATVHVSRYGLWYLALFYPAIAWIFKSAGKRKFPIPALSMSAIVIALLVIVNFMQYNPAKKPNYLSPSWASGYVYSNFPWLITPNPEIFAERNSGRDDAAARPPGSVVVGPGCRLVLLNKGQGAEAQVLGHDLCGMNVPDLLALVARRDTRRNTQEDMFLILSEHDISSVFGSVTRGSSLKASSSTGDLTGLLASGWSRQERWGVWSVGRRAVIEFSVREDSMAARDLEITLLMRAFRPKAYPALEVGITVNDIAYPDFKIESQSDGVARHRLRLPSERLQATGGMVTMELHIRNPISPKEAGLSDDARELGIGLLEMQVE